MTLPTIPPLLPVYHFWPADEELNIRTIIASGNNRHYRQNSSRQFKLFEITVHHLFSINKHKEIYLITPRIHPPLRRDIPQPKRPIFSATNVE